MMVAGRKHHARYSRYYYSYNEYPANDDIVEGKPVSCQGEGGNENRERDGWLLLSLVSKVKRHFII
jgi:hypothetical protein